MKKQIISILTITCLISGSFIGCSKINSPTEAIKPPNVSQESNFMGKYKELVKANSSPKQILEFIRANIHNLSKNDADIVVSGYIAALTKKLETYDYGEGFSPAFKEFKDIKEVKDSQLAVMTEEIKNKLVDAYSEGYKLHKLEDGYNLVVNFELIKTEFSGYLTEKYADYISIMAETVNGKDLTLFEVPEDLDYIASVLIEIENYRNKYKSNDEPKSLTEIYNDYLKGYYLGGKYCPTRDDDDKLKPEVLKCYKKYQGSYAGTNLEKSTTEFIKLLEKNKYKFTEEVFVYARGPMEE